MLELLLKRLAFDLPFGQAGDGVAEEAREGVGSKLGHYIPPHALQSGVPPVEYISPSAPPPLIPPGAPPPAEGTGRFAIPRGPCWPCNCRSAASDRSAPPAELMGSYGGS